MRIPVNENKVRPEAMPGFREKPAFEADQFGGQVGNELGQTGKTLSGIGNYIGAKVEEKEERESELDSSAILQSLSLEMTKGLWGEEGTLRTSDLLNAKGVTQRVGSQLDGIIARHTAGIKNPKTLEKVNFGAAAYKTKALGAAQEHEGQQFLAAEDMRFKTDISSLSEQASLTYDTDGGIQTVISFSNARVAEYGKAKGMSEDAIRKAQFDMVDEIGNNAMEMAKSKGELNRVEALYSRLGPFMSDDSQRKWNKEIPDLKEKRDKVLYDAWTKKTKNDFYLIDPEDLDGQATYLNSVKQEGEGELYHTLSAYYDRNVAIKEKKEEGPKDSDPKSYGKLLESFYEKELSLEMVYNAPGLSKGDRKSFIDRILKQENDGEHEITTSFTKQAHLIFSEIKDEKDRARAVQTLDHRIMVRGLKGDSIVSEAKQIVSNNEYKTGREGWAWDRKDKPYTATENEMVENAGYRKRFGDNAFDGLYGLTKDSGATRRILEATGVGANDPAVIAYVNVAKGLGRFEQSEDQVIKGILAIKEKAEKERRKTEAPFSVDEWEGYGK